MHHVVSSRSSQHGRDGPNRQRNSVPQPKIIDVRIEKVKSQSFLYYDIC